LYDRLAGVGFEYGRAFQGLRAVWRRGEEVFAEVALGADRLGEAVRFGLHPALFDSALHAVLGVAGEGLAGGRLPLPFAWGGVSLAAVGATSLRVGIRPAAAGVSLCAVDETGQPVLRVDSLSTRFVDAAALDVSVRAQWLHQVRWVPVSAADPGVGSAVLAWLGDAGVLLGDPVGQWYSDVAALVAGIAAGAPVPDVVCVAAPVVGGGDDPVSVGRAGLYAMLALVRSWLGYEVLAGCRLVVVGRAMVAAGEGEGVDLGGAPLVGLVRSAASEHPGRFALVDVDDSADAGVVRGCVGCGEEPELAVRDGVIMAPRLVRVEAQPDSVGAPDSAGAVGVPWPGFDPAATVLITGGTGGLGMTLARHLALTHRCGRLVLVSRRGERAAGAQPLREELARSGCEVVFAACDVSDRAQLAAVIEGIGAGHRLGAVIHTAGVLADGVVEALDGEQIEAVLAPKVDAGWYLHELTAGMELSAFILFSSAAGILGSPGQANYAAANTFLDALALYRRGLGLPAVSLAWGLWDQAGMTAGLGSAQRARITRMGQVGLSTSEALRLFDVAGSYSQPVLVPAGLDIPALRAAARIGMLPALLRILVPTPAGRGPQTGGSLQRRLRNIPESEWDTVLLDEVRTHLAAVLNHSSPQAVHPKRAFTEIGLDSLGAVELRNRLIQTTGIQLPATLVFDHPDPTAVARYLRSQLGSSEPLRDLYEGIDRIESILASIEASGQTRAQVEHRLRQFSANLRSFLATDSEADADLQISSDHELFAFFDEEFGSGDAE